MADQKSIGPIYAVMDAGCALCTKGANWIARNDRKGEIQIISMHSDLGRDLLVHNGLDPDDPASWLYVEHGEALTSVAAYVRVGKRLGGIWRGLVLLRILPEPLMDAGYHWIARNRYRLFGRTGVCEFSFPERE